MIFIPGKLYRLKCNLGFDELYGKNNIWISKNELILSLGKIEDPKDKKLFGDALLFLYENRRLWRTQSKNYDESCFEEEKC